ncbi:uncharacterized protein VTP21DRAFT_134 [Calcarisporiella thermophila]|uniref:uncharacterized protein n=1 Tax=Calcarisporiella thermophila TaxID=911321 RepID=UPI0037438D32
MQSKDFNPDKLELSTLTIHSDKNAYVGKIYDVAPPLHVSTTYRASLGDDDVYFYTREARHPTRDRTEAVLGSLYHPSAAVTYSSGLAAVHAALLHYTPRRVAIRGGYFGIHNVLRLYRRTSDLQIIDIDDELQENDLVIIESPQNPSGEIFDIEHYARRAHEAKAKLFVDATFGPPPLQDPFKQGADMVFHSTTKFLAGHSDALGGALFVKSKEEAHKLIEDRSVVGSVPGNLESWLLLRSLRTLPLRVTQQTRTATALIQWLSLASEGRAHDGIPGGTIRSVLHASIQKSADAYRDRQMPGGYGAVFSIVLYTKELAKMLPHCTQLLTPATSLGGAESLIEWRYPLDKTLDPGLVRVSIGLEGLEDLKNDFRHALLEAEKRVKKQADAN